MRFKLDNGRNAAIGRVVACEGGKDSNGKCADKVWVKLTSISTSNHCFNYNGREYCEGDELRWGICLDIYTCD